MRSYLKLLESVLNKGSLRGDRTGVGTLSLFGTHLEIELDEFHFPLLTTKKIHFKSVVYELLWFLRGETNIKYLKDHGVSIWDEWADEDGNLGKIYGKQWRNFGGVDQISEVMRQLREDPFSRRIVVSAWNVGELDEMRLPPCHLLYQFYVDQKTLSCQVYQRSADLFLGVPFNIASYALLLRMICNTLGLLPGRLLFTFGDTHIYKNHIGKVKEQLSRDPKPLPMLRIKRNPVSIEKYEYADIELTDYNPMPAIKAPIAI